MLPGFSLFLTISIISYVVSLDYSILEEIPNGTIVANLTADVRVPASTKFRIVTTTASKVNITSLFGINNGILEAINRIDRDSICAQLKKCLLNFGIAALDGSSFRLLPVSLLIKDRNDNSPIFKVILNRFINIID